MPPAVSPTLVAAVAPVCSLGMMLINSGSVSVEGLISDGAAAICSIGAKFL